MNNIKYYYKKKICNICKIKKLDIFINENKNYICNKCYNKLYNKKINIKNPINLNKYNPKLLKKEIDKYVIGHNKTKKKISVSIYNHLKLINHNKYSKYINLYKSNILLIGPTGSGKTLIAKTISNILDIPMVITDATTLTQAGYVGDDVENILLRLIQKCKFNIEKAEYGIIYIDEIDKIAKKKYNISITRDVSGEGVQQSLLKIIEGTISSVSTFGGRKHPQQQNIQINTNNILFICGGTFNNIDNIIKKRLNINNIGYNSKKKNLKEKYNIEYKDIIEFGFIPEFVGRFPIISKLQNLNKKHFIKILIKTKNSIIKYYKKLFKLENINLIFKKDAINKIADMAIKKNIGARSLKYVIENILFNTMYNINSIKDKEIIIDKNFIKNQNL